MGAFGACLYCKYILLSIQNKVLYRFNCFISNIVIIISLINFFAFQVAVSYSIVAESPSIFPTVTICNLIPFDTQNSSAIEEILKRNNIVSQIESDSRIPAINQVTEIREFLKAHVLSNKKDNLSYIQSLGFSLDSMLVSCNYNGIQCTVDDFYQFYDYAYGNCFAFNYNQTKMEKTSKVGPKYGLQLELFSGIPGKFIIIFQYDYY